MGNWETGTVSHTLLCIKQLMRMYYTPREVYSGLRDGLKGKEIHRRGDTGVHTADSPHCTTETSRAVQSSYMPVKTTVNNRSCLLVLLMMTRQLAQDQMSYLHAAVWRGDCPCTDQTCTQLYHAQLTASGPKSAVPMECSLGQELDLLAGLRFS